MHWFVAAADRLISARVTGAAVVDMAIAAVVEVASADAEAGVVAVGKVRAAVAVAVVVAVAVAGTFGSVVAAEGNNVVAVEDIRVGIVQNSSPAYSAG